MRWAGHVASIILYGSLNIKVPISSSHNLSFLVPSRVLPVRVTIPPWKMQDPTGALKAVANRTAVKL
jgi:hypothetical protein